MGRNPLRLRLLLSGVFLPFFAVAAVLFGVWAGGSGPGVLATVAAVCGVLAPAAALDARVVARRLRREGRGRRG
ncbi:hypothetical protein ACFWP5_28415 [Streptomyces sp. NPDC058469]|uniref:hypothetical protein n=1 Tax=Streptomyces sp. NPDC058469 TaxID=3346514 RepID=UPI003646FEC6